MNMRAQGRIWLSVAVRRALGAARGDGGKKC